MTARHITLMQNGRGLIYDPSAENPLTVLSIIRKYTYGTPRAYNPPFVRSNSPSIPVENLSELYEPASLKIRVFSSREAFK